jgi:hypothetical protein
MIIVDEKIEIKHFDVEKFKEGEMPLTTSLCTTILEVYICLKVLN